MSHLSCLPDILLDAVVVLDRELLLFDLVRLGGRAGHAVAFFAQLDLINAVAHFPACLLACNLVSYINFLLLENAILDVSHVVGLLYGAAVRVQKLGPIRVACRLWSQKWCLDLNNHRLNISLALLTHVLVV